MATLISRLQFFARLAIAGALLAFCGTATAGLLGPGASLFSPAGDSGPSGGTVIASQNVSFFIPQFTGTALSTVIQGDTTNPFGGLTFTYLLTNTSPTDSFHYFGVENFLGFKVDASYQTPVGAGIVPGFFQRSTVSDDIVSANFPNLTFSATLYPYLAPGQSSVLLIYRTDALAYQNTTGSVSDGTNLSTFGSYAPSIFSVPEPGSLTLAGLAVGCLGMMFWRRRGKQK